MDQEKNDSFIGNPEKICWKNLSINHDAISLLEKELKDNPNSKRICWKLLSLNINAIHLLAQYPERIFWRFLSQNRNAMYLLEKKYSLYIRLYKYSKSH